MEKRRFFWQVLTEEWNGPRKLDTVIMCLASNAVAAMYSGSTLNRSDAGSAVELLEQGLTAKSVALPLDLASGTLADLTDDIATLRATLDKVATNVHRHEEQLRKRTPKKAEA